VCEQAGIAWEAIYGGAFKVPVPLSLYCLFVTLQLLQLLVWLVSPDLKCKPVQSAKLVALATVNVIVQGTGYS
jgi:hypothetical protein